MSLSVRLDVMQAARDGAPVSLTRGEWMFVAILTQAKGLPVSRETFNKYMGTGELSRSPDTHIAVVRKKLGQDTIRTVHGVGWAARSALLNSITLDSGQDPEYMI